MCYSFPLAREHADVPLPVATRPGYIRQFHAGPVARRRRDGTQGSGTRQLLSSDAKTEVMRQ